MTRANVMIPVRLLVMERGLSVQLHAGHGEVVSGTLAMVDPAV